MSKNELTSLFRQAMWLQMSFNIARYMMANTEGRLDGAEKADRHMKLCSTYISCHYFVEEDLAMRYRHDEFWAVHDKTQFLTDFMDEEIGFPVDSKSPKLSKLAPLFFDRFLHYADLGLKEFNEQEMDERCQ